MDEGRNTTYNYDSIFCDIFSTQDNIKRNRRMFIIGALIAFMFPQLLMYVPDFLFTLKPSYSVEYVLENGVREGMHVSGQVPYTYDCFAELESTSYHKITGYYYAIPAEEGMLALYVPAERNDEMETLLEETVTFLGSGIWPQSVVEVEGSVGKAQGRIPYLFGKYMAEIGYTQAEIDAMGELLVIKDNRKQLQKARIYGPVWIIILMLVILGTVFYVLFKRKKTAI